MKSISIFLFLCILVLYTSGQSIVDTTKMWRTKITEQCPCNPNFQIKTETIKFSDDTIINLLNYKKVYRATDEFYTNWSLYLYIREDTNQRVYFRSDTSQQEYLLYDFNAHINDTLSVSSVFVDIHGNYVFVTSKMIVDSIDTIFFAGQNRKRINITCQYCNEEHWIEGIGNVEYGVLTNRMGFCNSIDITLLCVYQSDTLIYSLGENCYQYYDCPNNITEQQTDKINIYPNPAHNQLTVIASETKQSQISIYNLQGQEVKSIKTKGQSKKYTVNIADLPAGLYLLKTTSKQGTEVMKFIKE